MRDAIEYREELFEEEKRLGDIFVFDEGNEDEEVEGYEVLLYDKALVIRTLQTQIVSTDSDQRDQLFHTKCQVKDKWCSVIIDGGGGGVALMLLLVRWPQNRV